MKRLVLDVDTGVDDALALWYAARRPGIKLEAVTTLYGNVDVEQTTRNTLQILELAGLPAVPVAAGAAKALTRPPRVRDFFVHGQNGLGGVALPAPAGRAVGEHAAAFLSRLARANPGELTLVPTGPLTNVALCFLQDPEAARRFKEIVIMGGAVLAPGNITAVAEANIWHDPEAARIVFESGARITLVGLDVTMQVLLSHATADVIAGRGPNSKTMMDLTRNYIDVYQSWSPGIEGCALHDPLAVAVAEEPGLVQTQPMFVQVECTDGLCRGQTFAERRRMEGIEPNLQVCLGVDRDQFRSRFLEIFQG